MDGCFSVDERATSFGLGFVVLLRLVAVTTQGLVETNAGSSDFSARIGFDVMDSCLSVVEGVTASSHRQICLLAGQY